MFIPKSKVSLNIIYLYTYFFVQKMEIEMAFQRRIAEEGFQISLNPPGDGRCFHRAAAFQLGFNSDILHDLIFDYLESHQFDVSCCLRACA